MLQSAVRQVGSNPNPYTELTLKYLPSPLTEKPRLHTGEVKKSKNTSSTTLFDSVKKKKTCLSILGQELKLLVVASVHSQVSSAVPEWRVCAPLSVSILEVPKQ